jgi:hypothetical protein
MEIWNSYWPLIVMGGITLVGMVIALYFIIDAAKAWKKFLEK